MSETANATLQEAVDTRVVQPAVATFLRRQYRSAHRNQRRRRYDTTHICPSLRSAVYYFIESIHQYYYVSTVYREMEVRD